MQQRQLRLGDILDDYCPRERRVTNHAVVAMIGDDVKQTRCTTCDAEHEYKHARTPRQRKKSEEPAALYAQVAANAPKRVTHDQDHAARSDDPAAAAGTIAEAAHLNAGDGRDSGFLGERDAGPLAAAPADVDQEGANVDAAGEDRASDDRTDAGPGVTGVAGVPGSPGTPGAPAVDDEGPVHRPLIRASLPRPEGHQPPPRPLPEFTIRQPGGRPNRFRPRHVRGGQQGQQGPYFHGNRSNGNMAGPMRGQRPGGRPGMMKRHGPPGRKRSK